MQTRRQKTRRQGQDNGLTDIAMMLAFVFMLFVPLASQISHPSDITKTPSSTASAKSINLPKTQRGYLKAGGNRQVQLIFEHSTYKTDQVERLEKEGRIKHTGKQKSIYLREPSPGSFDFTRLQTEFAQLQKQGVRILLYK